MWRRIVSVSRVSKLNQLRERRKKRMRKTMTKEVTKTTVTIARVVTDQDGNLQAEQLPTEILIGNVSQEKAQKHVAKKFDFPVTVFNVEASTEIYEMAVEDFIKHATLVVDPQPEAESMSEAI